MKVRLVGKSRGFLRNLEKIENENVKITIENSNFFEKNSKLKKTIYNLQRESKVLDHIGFFKVTKAREVIEEEILLSYNRFMKTRNDYIIYLENPYALVNYSNNRMLTPIGKRKVRKFLERENLKAIICMSKICYRTLFDIYELPENLEVYQIYPYIPNVIKENVEKTLKNCAKVNFLFSASDFYFKGGKELLEIIKMINKKYCKVAKFIIIVDKNQITTSDLSYMELQENIKIYDFGMEYEDLERIYNASDVYLNPTRHESFGLTILEAMKHSIVPISTDIYAVSEIIEHGNTGYLVSKRHKLFTGEGFANEKYWNNRNDFFHDKHFVDQSVVCSFYSHMVFLIENKDVLDHMRKKAFQVANNGLFSESVIENNWVEVLERVGK